MVRSVVRDISMRVFSGLIHTSVPNTFARLPVTTPMRCRRSPFIWVSYRVLSMRVRGAPASVCLLNSCSRSLTLSSLALFRTAASSSRGRLLESQAKDASMKKAAKPAAPPTLNPSALPSVRESGNVEKRNSALASEYRRIAGSCNAYCRPALTGLDDHICKKMPDPIRIVVTVNSSGLISGASPFVAWQRCPCLDSNRRCGKRTALDTKPSAMVMTLGHSLFGLLGRPEGELGGTMLGS